MGQVLPWLLALLAHLPLSDALHESLSEVERHHLFGPIHRPKLGENYWVSWPEKRLSNDGQRRFAVKAAGQLFEFILEPFPDLLSREGFHSDEETSLDHSLRHCIYRGFSTSHNHTSISLLGCHQNARGMISGPLGHFLIHPVPSRHARRLKRSAASGLQPHLVARRHAPVFRDAGPLEQDGHTSLDGQEELPCLFDKDDDPFPRNATSAFESSRRWDDSRRLPVLKFDGSPLVIELGVFSDDAMWRHFRKLYREEADSQLQQFVLASVNNIHHLYSHSSLSPKVQLKITRYQVMKNPPSSISSRAHRSGEVDRLLEGFCQYQDDVNPASDADPRHWDHALLFSGYDLYRGPLKSVAGYAPVKGMCSGIRSCTINEGLDFGAVFVITHEMGHSLGMYHDGDNGCSSRCCVMSPSVGTGKTSWSACSTSEFEDFVGQLGSGFLPPNCLRDGHEAPGTFPSALLDHSLQGFLPGQRYNLDQQCRIFHGDCWKHELRDGQKLEEVCQMVWCGAGEGVIRTTHPALEGTHCGEGRWCLGGECRGWLGRTARPRPVAGGWTEWNDAPESSCGGGAGGCTTCSLSAQLRVRRSVRLCEDPPPNNGGAACEGSAYRALLCRADLCAGPGPDQYASQVCTKLRSNANTPDLLLSGKGFQYQDSPCKVWCHMTLNNFIRSVANFPDGAPCGRDSFCVKGECQRRNCDGQALVQSSRDCPRPGIFRPFIETTTTTTTSTTTQAPRLTPQSIKRARRRRGRWSSWQPWGACSASCGRGSQDRRRRCLGRLCVGTGSMSRTCRVQACPVVPETFTEVITSTTTTLATTTTPTTTTSTTAATTTTRRIRRPKWEPWASWSGCSATCGKGRQRRVRRCRRSFRRRCKGRRREERPCSARPCGAEDEGWGEWIRWGSCTRSCGGGVRLRRRECGVSLCLGRSTETEGCGKEPCEEEGRPSGWSVWATWSECSRRCGGGTRFRTRECDGRGLCFGSSVSFNACNTESCREDGDTPLKRSRGGGIRERQLREWGEWAEWLRCTVTCGGGVQRRLRECETDDSLDDGGRGRRCQGASAQTRSCAEQRCVVRPPAPRPRVLRSRRGKSGSRAGRKGWSAWSHWGSCSRSCGRGVSVRRRRCRSRLCIGSFRQIRYCNFDDCPGGLFLPLLNLN